MLMLSNATLKLRLGLIEMARKGGKGKSEQWQQLQQQKVVPRDAVGFAQHLKIWIIEFMDGPKQVVNFTYKKERVIEKNYKVWVIDCSDGNISNFV